jgi:hypothetical protein
MAVNRRRLALGAGLLALLASSGRPTFAAPASPPGMARKSVWRGLRGADEVQMTLVPKADTLEAFDGTYFVFGEGRLILLAGEIEGAELVLEESIDGSAVSGQWIWLVAGEVYSGQWHGADGGASMPFSLKRLPEPMR